MIKIDDRSLGGLDRLIFSQLREEYYLSVNNFKWKLFGYIGK